MSRSIALREIAYGRSGDKGAHANIGVIAYTSEGYLFLRDVLTSKKVQDYFSDVIPIKSIVRFELPNLGALNFILHGALGDGGSRSLYLDAQGKALAQKLLQMPLSIDEARFEAMRPPKVKAIP